MAWIQMIEEDEVAPQSRLGKLYRASCEPETGAVDNILKVHSLRPETLNAHLSVYRAAMTPRGDVALSRRERELLAVAVSAANQCLY